MPQPTESGIVSFGEARHIVEQHAATLRPAGSEEVDLLRSRSRVLAEEVLADRDFPPFCRATRDGYAVRAADLDSLPVHLEVVGEIRAGMAPEAVACTLQAGEAAEIMTGSPVPPGADAVVMVESTRRDGNFAVIERAVTPGENVVVQGAEARRGAVLLKPGRRMDYAAISVAASVGKARLRVFGRPRVSVLSTGDELVDVAATPGVNQIRNSNSYSLAAQVDAAGATPEMLPVAPDQPQPLRELMVRGFTADLLLLTGGVSMGKYDLVEQVLRELDAEFFFTGAHIQPGRPIVFGRVPRGGASSTYFFGLPGNPVSTMVTFELFARTVIDALAGAPPCPLVFAQARLKSELKIKTGLTRFLPARLTGSYERSEVELVRWQGSGDIVATAGANCYLVVPPDRERIPAGEMVSIFVR